MNDRLRLDPPAPEALKELALDAPSLPVPVPPERRAVRVEALGSRTVMIRGLDGSDRNGKPPRRTPVAHGQG